MVLTTTEHNLPFFELSDKQFEQLCLALLRTEGHRQVRHLGAAGSDGGCDLITTDPDGRRWVTQAKRIQRFGPKPAVAELQKVLDNSPEREIQVYLLAASCALSRRTESALKQEIADRRENWEVVCWGRTELDLMVRESPEVLRRFFGLPSGPSQAAWAGPQGKPTWADLREHLEDAASMGLEVAPDITSWNWWESYQKVEGK